MRIAITADLHLTTAQKNPERYQALRDIFCQCQEKNIQLLVIAGDLFDSSMANYADFHNLYQESKPSGLKTVIMPGNHDQNLRPEQFDNEGLALYSEPILQPLNDTRKILFIPYQPRLTMGEAIAPFGKQLKGQRWILVGHGDSSGSLNTPDPYEPGTYMPLTRYDIDLYRPELVFLGHIHLPQSSEITYYPGSPCPLNITETGKRSFLILDTELGQISRQIIHSQLEYYQERFVMVPGKDDLKILVEDIKQRINSWDLTPGTQENVQVRVEIIGTSFSGRNVILKEVNNAFSPIRFYQDPILNNLTTDPDPDRALIARQFNAWLDSLDWGNPPSLPTKNDILEKALKIIYKVE